MVKAVKFRFNSLYTDHLNYTYKFSSYLTENTFRLH